MRRIVYTINHSPFSISALSEANETIMEDGFTADYTSHSAKFYNDDPNSANYLSESIDRINRMREHVKLCESIMERNAAFFKAVHDTMQAMKRDGETVEAFD